MQKTGIVVQSLLALWLLQGCQHARYYAYSEFLVSDKPMMGYVFSEKPDGVVNLLLRSVQSETPESRKMLSDSLLKKKPLLSDMHNRGITFASTPFVCDEFPDFAGCDSTVIGLIRSHKGKGRSYTGKGAMVRYSQGKWAEISCPLSSDMDPALLFKDDSGRLHVLGWIINEGYVDLAINGTSCELSEVVFPGDKEYGDAIIAVPLTLGAMAVRVHKDSEKNLWVDARIFSNNAWHPVQRFRFERDLVDSWKQWAWDISEDGQKLFVFAVMTDRTAVFGQDCRGTRDVKYLPSFDKEIMGLWVQPGGQYVVWAREALLSGNIKIRFAKPIYYSISEDGIKETLAGMSFRARGEFSRNRYSAKGRLLLRDRDIEIMSRER